MVKVQQKASMGRVIEQRLGDDLMLSGSEKPSCIASLCLSENPRHWPHEAI